MDCKNQKFFICRHCGNIVGMICSSGVPIVCCGENMQELVPNTTDGAVEKHVPMVETDGSIVTVKIGSVPHPMTEQHYIVWVYLQTEQGGQRKSLSPGSAPEVKFALADGDKLIAAYAYCNLHGLWVSEKK